MLCYSHDPPGEGYALNLSNAPEALQPPEFHRTSPEEYIGFLRAAYRRDPRPFLEVAKDARAKRLTLYSLDRPDLVAVLHAAVVRVAARRGWQIDGGWIPPTPKNLSGRYVSQ